MPWPWLVLDEQRPLVCGEHLPQGTRAWGADGGAGGVLRAVGHDDRAGAVGEGALHLGGQRPLVVDSEGDRPQPHGRDEVEQTAPPRVLDGLGVAGPEMGGEHPLHGVEGSGGDGDGPGRHTLRLEGPAYMPFECGVDGAFSVEDRFLVALCRGRRERLGDAGSICVSGLPLETFRTPGGASTRISSRAVVAGFGRTRLPRRPAVSMTPRSRSVR